MLEAMKFTGLTQKSIHKDPSIMPAQEILRLATYNGAQVLGWENLGAIKEGYLADLIAIDLSKPHLRPISSASSIFSLIVYTALPTDISHVMINGIWRKKDNRILAETDKIVNDFDLTASNLLKLNS